MKCGNCGQDPCRNEKPAAMTTPAQPQLKQCELQHVIGQLCANGWPTMRTRWCAACRENFPAQAAQPQPAIEKEQSVPTVWDRVAKLEAALSSETQARELAESQMFALQSQFDRMSELAQSETQARQEAEKETAERVAAEFNAGLRTRCSQCEMAFPNGQRGSYGSYCPACNAELSFAGLSSMQQQLTAEREARQTAETLLKESQYEHARLGRLEASARDRLRAQLTASERARAQAKTERESLRTALGFDTPWSVTEVLRRLAAVAFHTREAHDCDHVGHEGDRYAAVEARKMADRIDAALSSAQAREPQPRHATDPDWPDRVGRDRKG